MNNICICNSYRENKSFDSYDDFNNFNNSITEINHFVEVSVENYYSNVGLEERWFKCTKCNKIWRLIEPDPPFKGICDIVK